MHLFFKCLLVQFVCMDISLGYDDISANKPAKQGFHDTNTDVAQNAVDRSFSTCSTTGASNPSWWYVDLEKVKSIYDVEIYFRLYDTFFEQRQRRRMYGYKLYISNSTDVSLLQEAYLCYNHTGPELPNLNVTHICVSFGRYVIFYNERVPGVTYPDNMQYTHTQLCEVIIQGCLRDDAYGHYCNETCPLNCQDTRCYITNGTCAGCSDGWIGKNCLDACPAGKYGPECKKTCTDHCGNNTSCNHVTGQCEGCLSGWMGHDCNEMCPSEMYGEGCKQNCSGNCFNNDTCYNVDGYCPQGCRDGFRGYRCNEQSVVDMVYLESLCTDQRDNVTGLITALVISLLINVGLCFIVLYFIRKKENQKENDQPSYEISDRGRSQQRSTSDSHLENHTYEALNTTRREEAPQVYRNLSLNDTRTNSL